MAFFVTSSQPCMVIRYTLPYGVLAIANKCWWPSNLGLFTPFYNTNFP